MEVYCFRFFIIQKIVQFYLKGDYETLKGILSILKQPLK